MIFTAVFWASGVCGLRGGWHPGYHWESSPWWSGLCEACPEAFHWLCCRVCPNSYNHGKLNWNAQRNGLLSSMLLLFLFLSVIIFHPLINYLCCAVKEFNWEGEEEEKKRLSFSGRLTMCSIKWTRSWLWAKLVSIVWTCNIVEVLAVAFVWFSVNAWKLLARSWHE